jgi:hypothetical protein
MREANVRLKIILVLSALALVIVLIIGNRTADLLAIERTSLQTSDRVPVLVELFTSEGCSSCPPADQLLAQLEQTQPIDGVEVIALSEHVDYWNRLGWTDPYSSPAFSLRQSEYARVFGVEDVYTPQMIVDGRAQFTGSNSTRARDAISNAAREPKATVQVKRGSEDTRKGAIALDVSVSNLPAIGNDAEVLMAITESGLSSSVARGENKGRNLSHIAVVRKLMSLGKIDLNNGAGFTAKETVRIEKTWKRENLRAVVFVQERKSKQVRGVCAVRLTN